MALAGALLGGGGLAALVRAKVQNRVDERTQLSAEQVQFREHMRAEIARLDERSRNLESRNQKLEEQVLSLTIQNSKQADQIEDLKKENETATRQLATTNAKNDFLERENNDLRRENQRLREKLPQRIEVTE